MRQLLQALIGTPLPHPAMNVLQDPQWQMRQALMAQQRLPDDTEKLAILNRLTEEPCRVIFAPDGQPPQATILGGDKLTTLEELETRRKK